MLKIIELDKVNLILILALLIYSFFTQFPSFEKIAVYVYSDSANYATLASRFAHGDILGGIHVWWLPFYPLLGGIFNLFIPNTEKALLFVSFFSGIFLEIPVYYLIYELTKKDRLLSVLGALLAGFNPVSVKHYTSLLTENLYTFTLILSCYLAFFSLRRNNKWIALFSGACFGFAFMTRNEAAAFLIVFWLFCLWLILFHFVKNLSPKNITSKNFYKLIYLLPRNFFLRIKKIKPYPVNLALGGINLIRFNIIFQIILSCVLGFMITIVPYYLIMSTKFGYLNLDARVKAAKNAYKPNFLAPDRKTTWSQDVWSVDTLNYQSTYFRNAPKGVKFNLYLDDLINGTTKRGAKYFGMLKELYSNEVLLLIIFGLIYSFGLFLYINYRLTLAHWFLILGVAGTLPFLPAAERRYILWIYPLIYTFIFVGVFTIKHLLRSKFVGVLIYIAAIYFFIQTFYGYLKALPAAYGTTGAINDYVGLGEFIKSQGKSNPRIMNRREAIGYYAKGQSIFAPEDDMTHEELRNYLKRWKVDYIVANMENIGSSKALSFLLDENAKIPDWLKVLKVFGEGKWRIIVYQVLY